MGVFLKFTSKPFVSLPKTNWKTTLLMIRKSSSWCQFQNSVSAY